MLSYTVSQKSWRQSNSLKKKVYLYATKQLLIKKKIKNVCRMITLKPPFTGGRSWQFSHSLLQNIQGLVHGQHESQWQQQIFDAVCPPEQTCLYSKAAVFNRQSFSGLACISSDAEAIKHCKPHFTNSHSRSYLVGLDII